MILTLMSLLDNFLHPLNPCFSETPLNPRPKGQKIQPNFPNPRCGLLPSVERSGATYASKTETKA